MARGSRLVISGNERWKLAARRTIVAEPEQVVGLHNRVNLARALIDDRALAVPVEAADGILVRVAVGAVHLYGVAGRGPSSSLALTMPTFSPM